METFLVVIGVIALLVVGGYRYEKRNAAANTGAHNIVCPHCKTSGNVSIRLASRKRGISGGKATGALMTGGASMFLTGLSRREPARELTCRNCGMTWDVV